MTTPYIEKQMYRFKVIYDNFNELQAEGENNLIRKEF